MSQKGVVFTTALTIKQCTEVFRHAADGTRGVIGRLTEVTAKVSGQGDMVGFYTPTFDSPFAGVDGIPDFSVGYNVLSLAGGLRAGGTPIHMYLNEKAGRREAQLVSKYTITGGMGAARVVRKFLDQFRAADPTVHVDQGNI